ncbi:hypothetical protein AAFN75_15920 [Algibacter sp. AS12]|uniref:3D domain-containing protein n=1 Tax=Algibacter sp. AS12 TaxID=3135773 RepID=UPI00398AB10E
MNKPIIFKTFICICVFIVLSCGKSKPTIEDNYIWKPLQVTATAYNSLAYQTNSNPHITAFGDSLKPGLKYIAVSRDLLKLGLNQDTPVKIEGLKGVYWVKDKMHSKWRNRIDIYMDEDVKAAKTWGRKKVKIEYGILKL